MSTEYESRGTRDPSGVSGSLVVRVTGPYLGHTGTEGGYVVVKPTRDLSVYSCRCVSGHLVRVRGQRWGGGSDPQRGFLSTNRSVSATRPGHTP